MQKEDPVYGLGARTRSGIELSDQEGHFIHMELLTLPGTSVHCAVVADQSEAKKAGWDVVFSACSQECAESLRDALQKEAYFGELFGLPGPEGQ